MGGGVVRRSRLARPALCCLFAATSSAVEMGAFAGGPEDGDEFHRAIDDPEPVRCERAELDRFTRFDHEILFAKEQTHPSIQYVHPVVTVMDSQLVAWGWAATLAGDANFERTQPARGPVGERPHRQAVTGDRFAADPWIRGGCSSEEFVGAD